MTKAVRLNTCVPPSCLCTAWAKQRAGRALIESAHPAKHSAEHPFDHPAEHPAGHPAEHSAEHAHPSEHPAKHPAVQHAHLHVRRIAEHPVRVDLGQANGIARQAWVDLHTHMQKGRSFRALGEGGAGHQAGQRQSGGWGGGGAPQCAAR